MDALGIARHWPFLDEQLVLGRWKNGHAALELLSHLQYQTLGEPVKLGRKRLSEAFGTAGEAGGIWRALAKLEGRNVIVRQRGSGTLPDTWSFRPDISHWRSMPWKESGRAVHRTLEGCDFCRALRTGADINPGPRLSLLRGREIFRLSERHHLGFSGVQTRGKGAERAANALSPAPDRPEARGKGAEVGPSQAPPTVSSVVLEELLLRTEGAEGRHALFVELLDRRSKPGDFVRAGLDPDQALMRAAIGLTDEEAIEAKARWGAKYPRGTECRVPSGSFDLEKIAEAIVVERTMSLEA